MNQVSDTMTALKLTKGVSDLSDLFSDGNISTKDEDPFSFLELIKPLKDLFKDDE